MRLTVRLSRARALPLPGNRTSNNRTLADGVRGWIAAILINWVTQLDACATS